MLVSDRRRKTIYELWRVSDRVGALFHDVPAFLHSDFSDDGRGLLRPMMSLRRILRGLLSRGEERVNNGKAYRW